MSTVKAKIAPKPDQSNGSLALKVSLILDRSLCSGLSETQLEAIKSLISSTLESMAKDLALPIKPIPKVGFYSKQKSKMDTLTPISLILEETELEFPYWFLQQKTFTLEGLEEMIPEAIHRQRESFLTPGLLGLLYTDWQSKTHFSFWEFKSLAIFCIKHGHPIKKLYQQRDSAIFDLLGIFETCVGKKEELNLEIIIPKVTKNSAKGKIREELKQRVEQTISYQLGIQLPPFSITTDEQVLEGYYQLRVNGLRLPIKKGEVLSQIPEIHLTIRRYAACFINIATLQYQLERFQEIQPDLAKAILHQFDLPFLAQLLRNLTWEGVPIRNLASIFETLLETDREFSIGVPSRFYFLPYQWSAHFKNAKLASESNASFSAMEKIRVRLGREIFNTFQSSTGTLEVFTLGEEVEASLFETSPKTEDMLIVALGEELHRFATGREFFILLVPAEHRRYLQNLLWHRFPNVYVLSFQEVPLNKQVVLLSKVGFP
ncbi:FHIPEP family type III secretion protein [Pleomorphovibrio marinus]|uniref:FHIPEP family type III secretion protein n=1 Tax=Pleomorphovibrio marinus TaxID=2164132 RepID=UPI000E0AB1F5|nr:FHIPEP family type III secretion protein [Pleomorphovibrio marinus]